MNNYKSAVDRQYCDGYEWYQTFYLKNSKLILENIDFDKHSFDNVYTSTDGVNVFNGDWDHNQDIKKVISSMENEIRGKEILDVGCRDGYYSCIFEGIGAIPTMVDCCDRFTRREMFRLLNKKDNFLHINLYQLKSINKKFPYIWCQDVLCHLDNPILALRILREICTEKLYLGLDRIDMDYDIKSYGNNKFSFGLAYENNHYTFTFSEECIKRILENCGFYDIEIVCSQHIQGKKYLYGISRIVDIYSAKVNPDFICPEWLNFDFTMRESDAFIE